MWVNISFMEEIPKLSKKKYTLNEKQHYSEILFVDKESHMRGF